MEAVSQSIALRLRGLRESLDLSAKDMAGKAGITEQEYMNFENAVHDIPIGILHKLASECGVDVTAVLTGDEVKAEGYVFCKKGQGMSVKRRSDYDYRALAYGFTGKRMEPFLVTVAPNDGKVPANSHPGQEFNAVVEGRMMVIVDGKEHILEPGDCIYYDSRLPHGMKALDGKPAKFLAIIV